MKFSCLSWPSIPGVGTEKRLEASYMMEMKCLIRCATFKGDRSQSIWAVHSICIYITLTFKMSCSCFNTAWTSSLRSQLNSSSCVRKQKMFGIHVQKRKVFGNYYECMGIWFSQISAYKLKGKSIFLCKCGWDEAKCRLTTRSAYWQLKRKRNACYLK